MTSRSGRSVTITALAALVAAAICIVVSAVVVGAPGLWGAVVGAAVVAAFFASTPAVLGPVAKADPRLSLLFAVIFFVTKVIAVLALFIVLRRAADDGGFLDAEAVSATVIATTLAWLIGRIVDATRDRTPTYDLPADD